MPTRSPCPRARTFSASSSVPILPTATTGRVEAGGAQRGADRLRDGEVRAVRIGGARHAAIAGVPRVRIERLARR